MQLRRACACIFAFDAQVLWISFLGRRDLAGCSCEKVLPGGCVLSKERAPFRAHASRHGSLPPSPCLFPTFALPDRSPVHVAVAPIRYPLHRPLFPTKRGLLAKKTQGIYVMSGGHGGRVCVCFACDGD